MSKVNLTPYATSMHVEGETGGSGGGALIVNIEEEGVRWILDKTWKEIKDAIVGGSVVYIKFPDTPSYSSDEYGIVVGTYVLDESQYSVCYVSPREQSISGMSASTENDYPYATFD